MHTCSTSKSSPSSDQRVWWRDRLDLQHDGVVYMVENFCCRASPTNSREGERKVARLLGLGGRCVCGEGAHPPSIYRGGGSPCPSSKPISSLNNLNSPLSRNPISSLNDLNSPLSRNPISSLNEFKLIQDRLGPMGPCAPGPMRPGHSLIGPCPLPEGGATLVPFRKVLEASGTIPINPEQFRTPKTALPYMNLILRTIPEPLVISRIPSETPNKNS